MFKFALVAVAAVSFAGIASATQVFSTCSPAPATYKVSDLGLTASATESCNFSGANIPTGAFGFVVNSITFQYTFDSSYNNFLTGGTVAWSFTGTGLNVTGNSTQTTSGTGIQTVLCTGAAACASSAAAAIMAIDNGVGSYTVTDSYTGVGPLTATTFNKAFILDYSTGAPEPASFAMIGGGLLALAAFARKRNA